MFHYSTSFHVTSNYPSLFLFFSFFPFFFLVKLINQIKRASCSRTAPRGDWGRLLNHLLFVPNNLKESNAWDCMNFSFLFLLVICLVYMFPVGRPSTMVLRTCLRESHLNLWRLTLVSLCKFSSTNKATLHFFFIN